jgi:hypothetical protein
MSFCTVAKVPGRGAGGLEGEPFVDDEGFVLPLLVEIGERLLASVMRVVDHDA